MKSNEYWRQRRNQINRDLGYSPKRYDEDVFSIGFFEISLKYGCLNIGFIDYEKSIDFVYQHCASFAFDALVNVFHRSCLTFQFEKADSELTSKIIVHHENAMNQIISQYGNGLEQAFHSFELYAVQNDIYKRRRVIRSIYNREI